MIVNRVELANVETKRATDAATAALRKTAKTPSRSSGCRPLEKISSLKVAICASETCLGNEAIFSARIPCWRIYRTVKKSRDISRMLAAISRRIPSSLPNKYSMRGTGLVRMV